MGLLKNAAGLFLSNKLREKRVGSKDIDKIVSTVYDELSELDSRLVTTIRNQDII